ncbi:homeobox protein vex1-like isoform X2 [Stegostoma tigrinum]|uniref:homeobox protein vex1-like isoform X2 n=1 Tax=Stegostoma tigrinum TaxID=3053191 RepID=UPI00202AD0BA|nr:homeobox protein vex1-like isoform X2 [Stegostoma tigrinum]
MVEIANKNRNHWRISAVLAAPVEAGSVLNLAPHLDILNLSRRVFMVLLSDVARVCWDKDSRTEEWAERRRLRTVFTVEQLRVLELSFQCQQYPGSEQRRNLAGELHLSETQVKTWFQNRRMKLKQQLQDAQAEAFKSRLFLQYFSNPYVSIQRFYPVTDSSCVAHFNEFGPRHKQTSMPLRPLDHQSNLPQSNAKATPCRFHPYLRI